MMRRRSYEAGTEKSIVYSVSCAGHRWSCLVVCLSAKSAAAVARSACTRCGLTVEVPRLPGRIGCRLPFTTVTADARRHTPATPIWQVGARGDSIFSHQLRRSNCLVTTLARLHLAGLACAYRPSALGYNLALLRPA